MYFRGKGTIVGIQDNEKKVTLKVSIPGDFRGKNKETGKNQFLDSVEFLSFWKSNIDPYTGKPMVDLMTWLKEDSSIEFEGKMTKYQKQDQTYAYDFAITHMEFAGVKKKKEGGNTSYKKPESTPVKTEQSEEEEDFDIGDF
jgi:hypothetical protein